MKRYLKSILVLTILVITSCSPKITSSFTNSQQQLSADENVALLDIDHKLPENTIKIGDLRVQDTMFSTDCSFNSLMNKARKSARDNGANIVKVIYKKKPDLWSSCYRLKIELYKFDGDLSKLKQYQLAID